MEFFNCNGGFQFSNEIMNNELLMIDIAETTNLLDTNRNCCIYIYI